MKKVGHTMRWQACPATGTLTHDDSSVNWSKHFIKVFINIIKMPVLCPTNCTSDTEVDKEEMLYMATKNMYDNIHSTYIHIHNSPELGTTQIFICR